MPSASARIVAVVTAERASGDRPSEDRIFLAPNAVIVLDGASQPDSDERNGGWLAEQIGQRLQRILTEHPRADLADALAQAIADTSRKYDLQPGNAPSTTVAIARWDNETVDALVLGDSPIIALTRSGTVHQLRDDRLTQVAADQHAGLRAAIRDRGGFGFQHRPQWTALVEAQRQARNRPGGYWIAEATPDAAYHAVRAIWSIHELAVVMAVTDGVADGIDYYGVPASWRDAFALVNDRPERLLDAVHEAEQSDPTGTRWPRSKLHDDKAVGVVWFAE